MQRQNTNISFVLLLISCSCAAQSKQYGTKLYEEDLSTIRVELKVSPKVVEKIDSSQLPSPPFTGQDTTSTVNEQVNNVLDSIAKLNKRTRYLNGYTIQIYSGQSRQEALAIKSKIVANTHNKEIENLEILVQYNQPNFLVTTGKYLSRLEAQKNLLNIKQRFPKAILLPKKILIQ